MYADPQERPYQLLSTVRALERRLRRLRAAWRSFRDEPSPAALDIVRQQAERLGEELRQLARGLDRGQSELASPRKAGHGSMGDSPRPAARDVVTASRELDRGIREASRSWKGVIETPDLESLRRLAAVLSSSAQRAGVLMEALGGVCPPDRTDVRQRVDASGGSAIDRIEARSMEIESLLWRIQSDWQHVRRAPTVERIARLRTELAEAAGCADDLRLDVGTAGATAFRRALRLGIHGADAVRFLPFRDPFTGVYNRQGFDALAGAELKRCRRYGRRFGLLLVRIQPTGLEDLRRLVATVRAELREYDLVGRYVDDLLVVGVPEGGRGATRRVASRLLRALRRPGDGRPVSGLGYATSPEDGATLSGLVDTATGRLEDPRGTP